MHGKGRFHITIFGPSLNPLSAALAIMLTLLFLILLLILMNVTAQPAQGQTFKVLYTFTGGADGANPFMAGIDRAGNLYGTTDNTIFKLSQQKAGWQLETLYNFKEQGGEDSLYGLTLGPDGNLYGAAGGGQGHGCYSGPCGVVFQFRPQSVACKTSLCPWTENVIYEIPTYTDGFSPDSNVVFDRSGNLYGTTVYGSIYGGPPGLGVLYEVSSSGSGWFGFPLHSFGWRYPDGDAWNPAGRITIDTSGNVYGTSWGGGTYGVGAVYMQGGGEQVIYSFQNGSSHGTSVVPDRAGNVYGTVGQAIFELSPSDNEWVYTVVYQWLESGYPNLGTFDAAGNLYGIASDGGAYGAGSIFKLIPSGGGWTYTDIYDFTGGSDGKDPSGIIFDTNGNLYGSTYDGGDLSQCVVEYSQGCGVVFEITP